MKKIIKTMFIATFVSLPILATLLFAGENCASEFHGTCMQVSINGSSSFPVCFEDATVRQDTC